MCYWFWTYGIMQVLLAIRSQGGEQALLQTMNRARELYAQRLQATPTFVRFTFPCIHSYWLAAPLVCPASLVFLHTGPKACHCITSARLDRYERFLRFFGARLLNAFCIITWAKSTTSGNRTSWNCIPRNCIPRVWPGTDVRNQSDP